MPTQLNTYFCMHALQQRCLGMAHLLCALSATWFTSRIFFQLDLSSASCSQTLTFSYVCKIVLPTHTRFAIRNTTMYITLPPRSASEKCNSDCCSLSHFYIYIHKYSHSLGAPEVSRLEARLEHHRVIVWSSWHVPSRHVLVPRCPASVLQEVNYVLVYMLLYMSYTCTMPFLCHVCQDIAKVAGQPCREKCVGTAASRQALMLVLVSPSRAYFYIRNLIIELARTFSSYYHITITHRL